VVPVQGVFEEYVTDILPHKYRLISGMTIAEGPEHAPAGGPKLRRQTVALLVFSRVIDQAALAAVARKTGMLTVLFAPDGNHRLALDGSPALPAALLRQVQALAAFVARYQTGDEAPPVVPAAV
jgi:hypothetical protein